MAGGGGESRAQKEAERRADELEAERRRENVEAQKRKLALLKRRFGGLGGGDAPQPVSILTSSLLGGNKQ